MDTAALELIYQSMQDYKERIESLTKESETNRDTLREQQDLIDELRSQLMF